MESIESYRVLHIFKAVNFVSCLIFALSFQLAINTDPLENEKLELDNHIENLNAPQDLLYVTNDDLIPKDDLELNNFDVGFDLLVCLRLHQFRTEVTFTDRFKDVGSIGARLIGPLYRSAYNGDLQCVKTLVKETQKSDLMKELINKRTKLGHSPLWAASYNGHFDVVKFLVENAGANIHISSLKHTTPMVISCQQGNLEIVKYLRNKDSELSELITNLTRYDNDGARCLYMACLNSHLDIVKYILSIFPTLIDTKNQFGQSPLWLASHSGSLEIVEYLIDNGAEIDSNFQKFENEVKGESPLIPSCKGGFFNIVKYLLSKNADVNATTSDGATCLYKASEFGRLDIVQHIIRYYQIDVNAKRINGRTPLYVAAINGNLDVVKELVENGKNINLEAKDEEGITPLLESCFFGKVEVIDYLIAKGANLTARTKDGSNCLILAAGMENYRKYSDFPKQGKCGNESAFKDILNINQGQLKTLVNERNNKGVSPIYAAAIQGQDDITEILLDNGAEADQPAIDGTTALMVAAYQSAEDWYPVTLVRTLIKKGKAGVNKESDCCRDNEKSQCCWSPLMSAGYHGLLGVVKELIEHGDLKAHSIRRVISQLTKLKPTSKPALGETEEEKSRKQKAKQESWNAVVQFLQCFESKKDVEKCMS